MNLSVWLIVLTSAFLHALWNFATKQVRGDLGIICVGMALASLVAAPTGIWAIMHYGLALHAMRFLLIRGVLQTTYFLTLAYAYRSGDLSFIYPIARGIGVAVAAVIAAFLLHEKLSVIGTCGITSVLIGTMVIASHPVKNRLLVALRLAILTGVTVGFMSINDKLAIKVMRPEVYIFLMHVLCFILMLPIVMIRHPRQFRAAYQKHLRPAAVVGIGSMLSYFLILIAFRFGSVSYITPVREVAVVIGAAMGVWILKEPITPRKVFGVLAIAAGAVLIKLA